VLASLVMAGMVMAGAAGEPIAERPEGGCWVTIERVPSPMYAFAIEDTGCKGKPFAFVYRFDPNPDLVTARLSDDHLSFIDQPGYYEVAVCYENGWGIIFVHLP
jgi:hypothetical protein